MPVMPSPLDRYRGAMLGLAAGDAVGTTLEFKPPGSFVPPISWLRHRSRFVSMP